MKPSVHVLWVLVLLGGRLYRGLLGMIFKQGNGEMNRLEKSYCSHLHNAYQDLQQLDGKENVRGMDMPFSHVTSASSEPEMFPSHCLSQHRVSSVFFP